MTCEAPGRDRRRARPRARRDRQLRDGRRTRDRHLASARRRRRASLRRSGPGPARRRNACRPPRRARGPAEIMVDIASAFASRARRRTPRTCCSGRRPSASPIESHQRDLDARPAISRPRFSRHRQRGAGNGAGDGLRLSANDERMLLSIGYRGARRRARPEAATICWRPRRGLRASSRSPRATSRRGTGSASAVPSPRSPRRRADLLVGIDVRIPDARRWSCARRPEACWSRPTG